MNRIDKNILLAVSIGDGYIRKSGSLQLIHSFKQIEYLKYKVDLVSKILGKQIKIDLFDNGGYPGCRAYATDKYFKILRRFLYKNGKKKITQSVLNRLSPLGIAIWYMDDGNIALHKRKGKIHSREIYLNTYCSLEEAKIIQEFFKKEYNIYFRCSPSKGYFRMICNTENAKKFAELIRPFIIESLKYKIDFRYNLTLDSAPTEKRVII